LKTVDTSLRIVVLDEGRLLDGGLDWKEFHQLGRLAVHAHTPPHEIIPRAAGAHIVLTNKTPLDARAFQALPDLRFVGVLATGYNVVDIEAARTRGIPVCNVPSYGTESVAQHTWALILELTNHAGLHSRRVAGGHWTASASWCAPCTPVIELAGLRLGLIGRGRIASRVADLGRAFGMEVVMASTSHPAGGHGLVSLEELASTSDVISLHCALNPRNHGFIDAAFLGCMKPTAFLVNTARGALINESDLAAALAAERIAGAALDVLSAEPPPADHPLVHAPRCLITPHMAWMGLPARRRLLNVTAGNIRAFVAGRPVHVVNA
jgi:glycerate dehydrogenase